MPSVCCVFHVHNHGQWEKAFCVLLVMDEHSMKFLDITPPVMLQSVCALVFGNCGGVCFMFYVL